MFWHVIANSNGLFCNIQSDNSIWRILLMYLFVTNRVSFDFPTYLQFVRKALDYRIF